MGHSAMEELKYTSPILHKLSGTKPMVAPDGYFDSLPERIQSKCVKTSNNDVLQQFLQPMFSRLTIVFGAVAFISIILAGYLFIHPQSVLQSNPSNEYVGIFNKAMLDIDYIESSQSNIDSNLSIDEYNEEVISYLVNDQVDYSTLLDEF